VTFSEWKTPNLSRQHQHKYRVYNRRRSECGTQDRPKGEYGEAQQNVCSSDEKSGNSASLVYVGLELPTVQFPILVIEFTGSQAEPEAHAATRTAHKDLGDFATS
jgi:hypothetical protein